MFSWVCMEVIKEKDKDGHVEYCGEPAAPGENRCPKHGGMALHYVAKPYTKPKITRPRKPKDK